MNTPLVTIPLSEYNQLKYQHDNFLKQIDGKYAYTYIDRFFSYTLVGNKDETIESLTNRITELNIEIGKLSNELYELKKQPRKNLFQRIFNKQNTY